MKYIRLILPILLLVLGAVTLGDYFGLTADNRKQELQLLIEKGVSGQAFYDDDYQEKKIKIAGIPIITYEVGYNFYVGESAYRGKKILNELPVNKVAEVTYLPSDPVINAINPQEILTGLDEMEGDRFVLYLGLVMILAGLGFGYFRLKGLKKDN